jgi:hypothetical protein
MQGPSLYSRLGETHGIVVYHAPSLAPAKLRAAFGEYGKPSVVRTYVLQDDNYATIVLFADASSSVACYVSLSLLVQEANVSGICSVGWLHESSEETFAQQPYVKRRYVEAAEMRPATPATSLSEGYLVVYWKDVPDDHRSDITQMAKRAATEVFEDDKEGGRSFFRFPAEDMADAFHSHVLSRYNAMRRCISYADATDFTLAKRSA